MVTTSPRGRRLLALLAAVIGLSLLIEPAVRLLRLGRFDHVIHRPAIHGRMAAKPAGDCAVQAFLGDQVFGEGDVREDGSFTVKARWVEPLWFSNAKGECQAAPPNPQAGSYLVFRCGRSTFKTCIDVPDPRRAANFLYYPDVSLGTVQHRAWD